MRKTKHPAQQCIDGQMDIDETKMYKRYNKMVLQKIARSLPEELRKIIREGDF